MSKAGLVAWRLASLGGSEQGHSTASSWGHGPSYGLLPAQMVGGAGMSVDERSGQGRPGDALRRHGTEGFSCFIKSVEAKLEGGGRQAFEICQERVSVAR